MEVHFRIYIIIRYGRLYVCVRVCVCLSVCAQNPPKPIAGFTFLWDDTLSSRDGSHLLFVTLGQRSCSLGVIEIIVFFVLL